MAEPTERGVDRRAFIRRAVAGAAALSSSPTIAGVQAAAQDPAGSATGSTPSGAAREAEVLTQGSSGSDYMLDVFKSLGLEYVCANPGSSFRGLHESVVNYGGNARPEMITCCHEESSVAMAHGYFKVEGRPIGVFAHGTVGLQHASMAIYNAYCDRVPVYIVLGNTLDATMRQPGFEWLHSVQDAAAMVRDYIKWDDLPWSLPHFAESAVRAYKIAMTPPMMPVMLVLDGGLQEDPISEEVKPRLRIPKLTLTSPPQGDSGAVAEAARLLVNAQNPVIIADRLARTPMGMARLVELAELLQAPVIDQGGRHNFPNQHPLNLSNGGRALLSNADVVLGLELTDFWGTVDSFRDSLVRTSRPITKPGTKLISISAGDLYMKGNYQDFQRYPEVDIAMAADSESTLPSLIEAVKRAMTADRKTAFEARGKKIAEQHTNALDRTRSDAAYAWDASPVSTARLTAELYNVVKNEDWAMVSASGNTSNWERRLWKFDKHYQWIGGSGGAGVGYGAPAAVGGALANKKHGRISVTIQGDGDFMYAPGVWWTAAHHRIPLLAVMHNNRGYHQEVMHVQRMGNRHNRGVTRAHIGTTLEDPFINYAQVVKGMGVYSEGPISNPNELGPAIKRALDVVKKGEPALVDVVTQPR
jgi:acetolactate synthase I/II/III large subunit